MTSVVRRGQVAFLVVIAGLTGSVTWADDSANKAVNTVQPVSVKMNDRISLYVTARQAEFGQIEARQKKQLEELGAYIHERRNAGKPVRLVFVCTHNSRRSHMAQLWAAVAAEAYGYRVSAYSGGTESSAFNPRAVAAMERAGFRIEKTTEDDNPIYHVRFSEDRSAMTCFSKKYDNAPNPKEDFAAIMVCGEADKACPSVPGANRQVAIPFVDPKVSDGTPKEAATYDERCAQIAREMLYVMNSAR